MTNLGKPINQYKCTSKGWCAKGVPTLEGRDWFFESPTSHATKQDDLDAPDRPHKEKRALLQPNRKKLLNFGPVFLGMAPASRSSSILMSIFKILFRPVVSRHHRCPAFVSGESDTKNIFREADQRGGLSSQYRISECTDTYMCRTSDREPTTTFFVSYQKSPLAWFCRRFWREHPPAVCPQRQHLIVCRVLLEDHIGSCAESSW